MMMEGAAGRMASTNADCQRCTIELLELYNRAVLSAVKAALPAVGPNSAFLMRRPNATQNYSLQSLLWPQTARYIQWEM